MDISDALLQVGRLDAGAPLLADVGVVTQVSPLIVAGTSGPTTARQLDGLTVDVSSLVLTVRTLAGVVVVGTLGVGTAPTDPDPAPTSGSSTFVAEYSFSWRDGDAFAWQGDVRQGTQDASGAWSGAWFYQGVPSASLDGATVTGCAVRVRRAPGGTPGPQAAHIYQSSAGSWPTTDYAEPATSGSPTDVTLASGAEAWVTLPAAVGQAIVDTGAGLMIAGSSPQVFLTGRDDDPESGLLRIDWTRP